MRNMLFGFGAGLVLLSLILLVAYGRDTLPQAGEDSDAQMVTDDEIAERAGAMGMIWPEESTLSDVEVIRRAFELGMVFEADATLTPTPAVLDPAPTATQSPPEPTTSPGSTTLPEPTTTPEPTTPTEPTTTQTPLAPAATSTPTPANEPTVETQSTDAEGEPITLVTLTIHAGENALNVARQLYDAGLITDVDAYVRHLANLNKTRIIRAGRYTIQKGASFEAITAVITQAP